MKKIFITGLFLLASTSIFAQMEVNKQIQMTGTTADDKRIIGVSNASAVTPASTDAVNIATLQSNYLNYGTASFLTGAYTLTLTPAPAQYWAGMVITFRAGGANTGDATINVNGLGVKPLVKSGNIGLLANEVLNNQMIMATYNPTGTGYFEMTTQPSSMPQIQNFHIYNTASRLAVTSITRTVQPGMTQSIIVPAGHTAIAVVSVSCGMRNTSTTSGQYSGVDGIIFYDGAFLPQGGWYRHTTVNHGSGNSLAATSTTAQIVMTAGTHTIDFRTARVSGNTSVDIGGDAVTDTNAGEMHITVYIY